MEQIRDTAKKLFENARTSFEDVHAAERELLAARLAYTDTQAERIKACDEAVQEALRWQEVVKAMKSSAVASPIAELQAQAFLLEIQITRENAVTDQ